MITEISEPLADGMTRRWRVDGVLHDGETAYQHIVIATTAQGISLFCDDDRQSTEFSQLVYHEAMIVPALLLADSLERVLIIGSSEGVASQIAVAAGAAHVDHVDIDREAVELCAKHLPYGYSTTELPSHVAGAGPIRLHYADGWDYLSRRIASRDRYDVVLVDLPDEREGPAQHNRLYGDEFLGMATTALRPGGVVAMQAGCPTLWRNTTLIRSWRRFTARFATPVYFGSDEHEWAFLFGRSDGLDDPVGLMEQRLSRLPYHPESIDAEALRSATIPPHAVRHAPPT